MQEETYAKHVCSERENDILSSRHWNGVHMTNAGLLGTTNT
jgi:hypothetical protein